MKKSKKTILRLSLRYLLFSSLIIFSFFFISVSLLLSTQQGQIKTASILSGLVERRIQSKVVIASAKIGFNEITLEQIRIFDHKDTLLLEIPKVKLDFNFVNRNPFNVYFKKLSIHNAYVNAVRHDTTELFNFQYIIERLIPEEAKQKGRIIYVGQLELHQGTARYWQPDSEKPKGYFDYEDMFVRNINVGLRKFTINQGRVEAVIKYAEAVDKSGLQVNDLQGYLTVDNNQISVSDFDLKLCESGFMGDFAFLFDGFLDFQDFIPNIIMKIEIDNSFVNLSDLAFFVPDFKSNEKSVNLKGNLYGTVDNLRVRNVDMVFGQNSVFSGDLRFNGLPDIPETLIDVDFKDFRFSLADLSSLVPVVSFPHNLDQSGSLRFEGRYTGFINDFVAFGNIYSSYGDISTDINFKISPESKIPSYSGMFKLKDFDLGGLLMNKVNVGKTTLEAGIKGRGFTLNELFADIDARIDYLDFNQYRYNNIEMDGHFEATMFNGILNIRDEHANLSLEGSIDMNQSKPVYNFNAKIKNTDLHKLNFLTDKLEVNCMLDINIAASSLDDIEGRVLLLNGLMVDSARSYEIRTMLLESDPVGSRKNIVLRSDIMDARMEGDFMINELAAIFKHVAAQYMDSSFQMHGEKVFNETSISFEANLIQTAFINNLLKTPVFFSDGSSFRGNIDFRDNDIRLTANVPGMRYKDFKFDNLLLNAKNRGSIMNIWSSLGHLSSGDSMIAEQANITLALSQELIDYGMYFYNRRFNNHLNLNGKAVLKKDSLLLMPENTFITATNNVRWQLISDTITVSYEPEIRISYLELKHDVHTIKAVGTISKSSDEAFRILLDNTEFSFIRNYLPVNLEDFSGVINGQLVIYNMLSNPYFDAAFAVNPLLYQSKELGLMTLTSNHHLMRSSKVNINGMVLSPDMEDILEVGGFVDLGEEKSIDLTVNVPQTSVKYFEAFVDFLASDLKGDISGSLNFKGPLDNYKIKGSGTLSDVGFTIDYTKVSYKISHTITIDERGIYMNNGIAYDDFGNPALIFGEVKHNYFQDIFLSIGILAQNLFGLNTEDKDDPVYFGKAYASGRVDITGPLDAIKMDLKIKSEPGTKISLKAYDESGFGNHSFIFFTSAQGSDRLRQMGRSSNIALNLDMEVTEMADIEIIFDPVTNDLIKAKGNGSLKFALDFAFNPSMYGTFFIEEGEYTFNALGLLKKKFLIRQGSNIVWRGEVFEAEVNIEAYNRLEASVFNLIRDNPNLDSEQKDLYRQKSFPVEAKLKLSGSLFNPDVALDFDIQNLTSISGGQQSIYLDQQIKNIKNNEQELNKQVISLLVLNSFLPPETGIASADAGGPAFNANVGSIFSSQINQWISEFSGEISSKYLSNFQLGVNYAAENEQYQRELDVLLGGSLFNDRIVLSGSYDVENINANFQANFQLLKDRKMRLKVFSRSDNNPIYHQDINRQGVGVYFREDFDSWAELFKRK